MGKKEEDPPRSGLNIAPMLHAKQHAVTHAVDFPSAHSHQRRKIQKSGLNNFTNDDSHL